MSGPRTSPPEVVVVGSAMVDLVTYVERMPAPGETIFASGFAQGFGGKGANQAGAVALHGVNCSMVACVGDDLFGPATVADLRAFGVDATHVATIPDEVTGTATILVEPSGENRIALGPGANRCLDARGVASALRHLVPPGREGPAAVASQLETSQEAAVAAFEWARDLGAVTVLTPAPATDLSPRLLELSDWLVPNETELVALLGLPASHPVELALSRAGEFASDSGVNLVVTLGALGAAVLMDGTTARVPAPTLAVRDTTGAGDAFAGAFIAALALGAPASVAARRAVAFASDSVTRLGTRASYRAPAR
jgi:ribokinase